MGIVQDTIKNIKSTIDSSSITCPVYFDHNPQTLPNGDINDYPVITYSIIDSPRTYSMLDNSLNHTYSRIRVQFSIFGNEDQQQEAMDISDSLEDLFKFYHGNSTSNTTTWICTHITNQNINFYSEAEKIWAINLDVIFIVGD